VEFIDPASGDFRLSNNSRDAYRLGFQNFDMTQFGVVSERLKSIAEKPKMPIPVFAFDKADNSKVLTWESIQIKNMETLGERSATGMDSERGVYVVAVGAYGSELRDYLKSNDVILGFANKPVNSIDDLFNALANTDLTKPQQMIIYRNQKENTVLIPGGIIRSNLK
jgi:S1-C subfamily serine protease